MNESHLYTNLISNIVVNFNTNMFVNIVIFSSRHEYPPIDRVHFTRLHIDVGFLT
jgi:hypothetical protein